MNTGTSQTEAEGVGDESLERDTWPGHVEEPVDLPAQLAPYVTGLSLNDPLLAERMIEDGHRLRAKYGLPNREAMTDPHEYERRLRAIADSLDVPVRGAFECGTFFTENPSAAAVYFEEVRKIGVPIDRSTRQRYGRSLVNLEHEIVHAVQWKESPRMSPEEMEYEAYVACGRNEILRGNPVTVRAVFSLIGASVNHWYKDQSEKEGRKIVPAWL